jgi:hypothetical protein
MTLRRVVFAVLLVLILHSLLLLQIVRDSDTTRGRGSPEPVASLTTTTFTAPEETTVATAPVEASYFGNTNSHKFHRSTCRYAHCKNCTAKFRTRQEAIDAGYRPGGFCDP